MSINSEKIKKLILIILCCVFIAACTKERPPVGNYIGFFTYDDLQGNNTTTSHSIEITESSKKILVINGQPIDKDKHNIEGNTDVPGLGNIVYLKGKWKKKFLSKDYLIEGTFIAKHNKGGPGTPPIAGGYPYTIEGTFTIKSNVTNQSPVN